ncbi:MULTISPECIES: LCP family protein [Streptomyces]|uniref:LCP family protein n=1 Tax=Streptomyces cyaneofuscatus TaxID=66883 RepID=A0ABZ1EV95_9ACTN|nr:LCP family protein [Streptomyces cyaneofuscatus]WSB08067.1 LCP family protein [Streptomyces cyaneofuscatus]WSD48400.1 LCP family protein [Streptomyces cyaneofuscatus]WTA91807.1 LCP family protein [Streptomyces cyaneofuscatus]
MGGPVGRSSTHGEGTRSRVRHADRPGGDEGLYENGDGDGGGRTHRESGDGGTGEPAANAAGDGPGRRAGSRGRNSRGRSARSSSRRAPKSGKRRALRWVSSAVALLILGAGGAGYLYYEHLNGNIKKEDLTLGDRQMADHKANAAGQTPLNILLIGSDARDSAENQKLGGAKETFGSPPLADVQMLLHLSADRSNLSVVSMPRDTMLKMPKCTAPDGEVFAASTVDVQTNQSLRRGGPGCTVAAWYELTGIRIDHFMMIDFAGVVSMADAIGGVPVCVDANIYSRGANGRGGSGLKLEAGTHSVQGEQALQWLRTRYGFEDGSDLARAKAQHQYMNSMVRQLRKGTKLTDPAKLMNLAEAATTALTVDKGLDTVKKLYDLAEELKKVPTKRITMSTMPNVYGTGVNAGRVYPKAGDAEQLFRMVREDMPLDGKASKRKKVEPKDPSAPVGEIAVAVRNGTATDAQGPVSGRAGDVEEQLKEAGFAKATIDPDNVTGSTRTSILYPSADLEGDAQAVAKALGVPVSQVKRSTDVSGISLAVGADWREDGAYPVSKGTEKTPDSAGAQNGEEEGCMTVDPKYTW